MNLPLNKIIHGDCLEVMKTFPDKSVDLVLTDPPYGIGMDKGAGGFSENSKVNGFSHLPGYENLDWDNSIPSKEYFTEIMRVSKNQIIFGGNYFIEYLENSPCWIVWDKKEEDKSNMADCELAWTSFKTAVRKFHYGWVGFDYINNSTKDNDKKSHPTQKPVELFKWCLEKYSEEDMTILDPFGGSCTTAVACKQLKRNYICIEKEEKYVAICHERLAQDLLF